MTNKAAVFVFFLDFSVWLVVGCKTSKHKEKLRGRGNEGE
jgi:hypothetical protein